MNNKNKKILVNAIIGVFAITFLVGAAFAFAPGILDVRGAVNIAVPDYVVWSNVEAGPGFSYPDELSVPDALPITAAGWEYGATHSAVIVEAGGRTNQRIEWNINFYQAGFADITATVTNESALHSAIITNVNFGWGDEDITNNFGDRLIFDVITGSFIGTTLAPGASATVTLSVEWDGTLPAGSIASDDVYIFVNTFFIEFDYELTTVIDEY